MVWQNAKAISDTELAGSDGRVVLGCPKGVLFVVARITGCLVVQPIEQENVAATRKMCLMFSQE
jgi:hypothetical protein